MRRSAAPAVRVLGGLSLTVAGRTFAVPPGSRRLLALEELGRLLQAAGRARAAVAAVQVAVLVDPLRESGQRALIEAHQAAGDRAAARRQYDRFRGMPRREVGVEPSAELTAVPTGRSRVPAAARV